MAINSDSLSLPGYNQLEKGFMPTCQGYVKPLRIFIASLKLLA